MLRERSGPIDSLTLWSVGVFIATVAISVLARERLFPFSTLGMFSYPYRRHSIVFVKDEATGAVVPTPKALGSLTSGLSQEVAMHIAGGASPVQVARELDARLRSRSDGTDRRFELWLRTIDVDRQGRVTLDERRLEEW